jgi:Arabinose-binding domain of AraC transcription regulator, N-term
MGNDQTYESFEEESVSRRGRRRDTAGGKRIKTAKIDPGPLLAKAGIAPLELGEEPKRVGAESQIRFLEITAEALGDPVLGLHLAQHFDLRVILR